MYPTDGLTSEELAYVDQYADAINGIPDSFDQLERESILGEALNYPTTELLVDTIQMYVGMLECWHGALDILAADLSGPDDRYSANGVRFLLYETETREKVADAFHRAVVAAVAGKVDPTAQVNDGTRSTYCYSAGFVPDPDDCGEPSRPALRPVPTA